MSMCSKLIQKYSLEKGESHFANLDRISQGSDIGEVQMKQKGESLREEMEKENMVSSSLALWFSILSFLASKLSFSSWLKRGN